MIKRQHCAEKAELLVRLSLQKLLFSFLFFVFPSPTSPVSRLTSSYRHLQTRHRQKFISLVAFHSPHLFGSLLHFVHFDSVCRILSVTLLLFLERNLQYGVWFPPKAPKNDLQRQELCHSASVPAQ